MDTRGKVVIGLAAVAGATFVGYALIKGSTGARGGACNDPTSPCYAATQPYIQAYQSCANSYAYYQHQFNTENAANKTGLTQDQVNTLNYYQSCMDSQASNIAKAAAQFVPPDGLQSLLIDIGEGIALAAVVYAGLRGAPSIIKTLKTPATSGSAVASKISNSMIQAEADEGIITGIDATAFSSDLDSRSFSWVSGNTALYNELAAEAFISQEESAAVARAVEATIPEDIADTEGILARL